MFADGKRKRLGRYQEREGVPYMTHDNTPPLDWFSKLKYSTARRAPVPNKAALEIFQRRRDSCPKTCRLASQSCSLRGNR